MELRLPSSPKPRLLACPPPQPLLLVTIQPDASVLGAPPLRTFIPMMVGDTVFVLTPDGMVTCPVVTWPPQNVSDVYAASGEWLWSRAYTAEHIAASVAEMAAKA